MKHHENLRQPCRLAKAAIVALATVLLVWPVATVGATEEKPLWHWTKANPKPVWWHWGKEYETSTPVRGGYLRTATERYIGLMNPNHWPVNDWVAMTKMYEMIMLNGGEFRPSVNWLCDTWRYTGPTTAILTLKKGIKFHDGSELTAKGYKYQYDWIKDRKNGAWSRSYLSSAKKLEVVDKYTLKWTFTKPWAGFPGAMANVPGYAISAEALKADRLLKEAEKYSKRIATSQKKIKKLNKRSGKKAAAKLKKENKKLAEYQVKLAKAKALSGEYTPLDQKAVGTGRFILEEARPGNYLKLKRNPNWWFGQSIGKPEMPYLDGRHISVIPDMSVRLANFRAGRLDSLGIEPAQFALVKYDKNIKLYKTPRNNVAAYWFNHTRGIGKDIRVRKAISHAIDRRAIIYGTLFGLGIEASCIFNEGHWAHNPNLKPVQYNPELSKRLLAEAGYPNGLTIRGYSLNDNWSMVLSQATKNMLSKVGVNWEYDTMDPVAIDDRRKNLEFDFGLGGWEWMWDADLVMSGMYHPAGGFNGGRTNNKEVIALIEAARSEMDFKKRQQIYWKMEEVLYNNYEDVWLWWPISVSAYRKSVRGFNPEMNIQGREGYGFSHPLWFENGRR